MSSALDEQARQLAEQAAVSPAAHDPALRLAAWRLGRQLGLASQFSHTAAITGSKGQADSAARIVQEAGADAERLGVAPVGPLQGHTLAQAGALLQRIEADELGIAARIEARTSTQHRHLFLAGMHAGMQAYARMAAVAADANLGASAIERHARLAGLPLALWQPLAYPRGATEAERREAFFAAMQALDSALQPRAER